MRAMKISALRFGNAFALCSLVWSVTAATLDQRYMPSQEDGLTIDRSQTVAQTFEVGLSGALDRVEVELARNVSPGPDGMTLEIRATLPNGSPTTSALASVFVPAADVSTSFHFMDIDLGPFSLMVTQGERLAVVLRSDIDPQGNPFVWRGDAPGGYTHGTVYIDRGTEGFGLLSGYDLGFRTYMDTTVIPEPSSLALLFSAAGVLIFRRHHAARHREPG
jgi:hypothetical protein